MANCPAVMVPTMKRRAPIPEYEPCKEISVEFGGNITPESTYTKTKLLGDLDQTGSGALTRHTLGLVDLGEHGVGGLRDDGGGETGNETRAKVDGGLHTGGGSALVNALVDGLGDLLVNDELGHGVGNPESMVSMH